MPLYTAAQQSSSCFLYALQHPHAVRGRAVEHLSGRPSITLRMLASFSRAASACASGKARRDGRSTCKDTHPMREASMQLGAPAGCTVASFT